MTKEIRVLTIIFEPEIRGEEVRKFRGAIINKVGKDCILFHNHLDDEHYNHHYPLIQYKRIRKHATIICIDQGVDEIYRLFQQPDWKIKIGNQEKELKVKQLKINKFQMNVWQKHFNYRIFNWLALNSQNYRLFNQTESLSERMELLERILTANILSFAKGIDWLLDKDKHIEVKIKRIVNKKVVRFKDNLLTAFDIDFSTNVFLPENISLGKAASHGFGMVRRLKQTETTQKNYEDNAQT